MRSDAVNLTQTRWADEQPTQELRVPPAAAEWRVERGLPPIGGSKFERRPRPPRPGCHRLKEWRALMRMPENFPFKPTVVHELNEGLEYDEYGVIVLPENTDSAIWRHAARHTARRAS
jgi:hypothetical protein